jgi:hypothetical protein
MRFQGDFRRAGTVTIGRLIGRYEPNLAAPPKKYQAPAADTLGSIQARMRFEGACRELGPLAAIVIHTAVLDQPAEEWAPTGQRNADALALLRFALSVLHIHYGKQRYGSLHTALPNGSCSVPLGEAALAG